MNRKTIPLLTFAFLLNLSASAAVPLRWTVETSRVQPVAFDAYHGETLDLAAAMTSYGDPLNLAGKTARLYWTTNATSAATTIYWSTNASVTTSKPATTNVLAATFSGAMDTGASTVRGFIGVEGDNYRASFVLRFRPSPGFEPSRIPLPTPTLDFASTTVVNPEASPFAVKGGSAGISASTATNITDAILASSNLASSAYVATKRDKTDLAVYNAQGVVNNRTIAIGDTSAGSLIIGSSQWIMGDFLKESDAYTWFLQKLYKTDPNETFAGTAATAKKLYEQGSTLSYDSSSRRWKITGDGEGVVALTSDIPSVSGFVTTNDVANIVTNDVDVYSAWSFTGSVIVAGRNYALYYTNFYDGGELIKTWILTENGNHVNQSMWNVYDENATVIDMWDEGCFGADYCTATRTKSPHNALGLAYERDIPALIDARAYAAVTNNVYTKAAADATFARKGEMTTPGYSWMRTNDWCVVYVASNSATPTVFAYNSQNSSGQIFTNEITTLTNQRGGVARIEVLDPTATMTPVADAWASLSPGMSIDQNGAFRSAQDGLYRIRATKGGGVRYAEVAVQLLPASVTTNTIYWADAAGSRRKAVNDAAKAVLLAATTNSVHGTGADRYVLFNTFPYRMTSVGAGNVKPFAVSAHVLACSSHYANWVTGTHTFDDGNGHTASVTKRAWVRLYDWALTNGFTQAEVDYAEIADVCMVTCDRTMAVPDGCIPWFMSEYTAADMFGDTVDGVQAWFAPQEHGQAVPCVLTGYTSISTSPIYYQVKLARADICRRMKEMGRQYNVHGGDSGKPCFVVIDGKPVVMFAFHYDNSGSGDNYVKGFRIVKAFVEWYGDNIKEYRQ